MGKFNRAGFQENSAPYIGRVDAVLEPALTLVNGRAFVWARYKMGQAHLRRGEEVEVLGFLREGSITFN